MRQGIRERVPLSSDLLEMWKHCGGYYQCPKDSQGKRLGPLVGYAGQYEEGKHFVGDVYFNFAKVEEFPHVLDHFAYLLAQEVSNQVQATVVLGAPMGGILLAGAVGRQADYRVLFAEKKILAVATPERREQSAQVLDRHEIESGDLVVIVEDVCNNFSTTEQLAKLVYNGDGRVVAIACALNRSGKRIFVTEGMSIPVYSTLYLPSAQYRQDDPAVGSDIARGNVVWKPKKKEEWPKLTAAMTTT